MRDPRRAGLPGRPRRHEFTYDDARRVRLRLVRTQQALRELAYALESTHGVQEALRQAKPDAMAEVAGHCDLSARGAYSELVNVLRDAYDPVGGS